MTKRTFCDGCDDEIKFDSNGVVTGGARVGLRIRATCDIVATVGDAGLGQFSQDNLDLCSCCIERMKRELDAKSWARDKEGSGRMDT